MNYWHAKENNGKIMKLTKTEKEEVCNIRLDLGNSETPLNVVIFILQEFKKNREKRGKIFI